MVLYDVFVVFMGFCGFRSKCTTSDLDRSHLTNKRSAENDWIGANTIPEYRIDASLVMRSKPAWNYVGLGDMAQEKNSWLKKKIDLRYK